MESDKLYINGKDAWEAWGVFLEDGCDGILLTPADNKEFISNKFRSEHGKRIIVDKPLLDERNLTLIFCILADTKKEFLNNYDEFVSELRKGTIKLKVAYLERTYILTEPRFQPLSFYETSAKLSVRFDEPNPDEQLKIVDVLGTLQPQVLLTLDGQGIKI